MRSIRTMPVAIWAALATCALWAISFFLFGTPLESAATFLLLAGVLYGAWRVPGFAFVSAMVELVATSHGHLLHLSVGGASISLRMALFAIVLGECVWRMRKEKMRGIVYTWLIAGAALMVMSVLMAWLHTVPLVDTVRDAMGYVAFAYVLVAWQWRSNESMRTLLWQALSGASVALAAQTLLLFFAFAHGSPLWLDGLYHWVRDTRLGEPTLQFPGAYRLFLPSQWFLVPWVLFTFLQDGTRELSSWQRVAGMLVLAALFMSLSRTFWLALGVGGVLLIALSWKQVSGTVQALRLGRWALMAVGSIGIIWCLYAIPVGFGGNAAASFASFFSKRFQAPSADAALDSRQKLRPVLEEAIAAHPWLGNGLGTRVSYHTSDPRYIGMHGTDLVSPIRVEWGWHDIWVKFGIGGLLWFAAGFLWLWRTWWQARGKAPMAYGALSVLMALTAAHAFSPYLNHPIGAGTLALLFLFLPRSTYAC